MIALGKYLFPWWRKSSGFTEAFQKMNRNKIPFGWWLCGNVMLYDVPVCVWREKRWMELKN
jgi:hypothetical protein